MPMCKIKVCPKNQTEPAFPELTEQNTILHESELYGVAFLEGGMQSGNTSIGIVIKTHDDKFILVQTSAAILQTIYHALYGAEQRFLENKTTENGK